jgi:triosephosphate isomerase
MRKKIIAGNWKMNLSFAAANALVHEVLRAPIQLPSEQITIFAAPFPYLQGIEAVVSTHPGFFTAGQNCHSEISGAYTGEVSAAMLQSIGVNYVILGHSERREYFSETNALVGQKLLRSLEAGLHPIFCCGESLEIRQGGTQNDWVKRQIVESLQQFSSAQASHMVIAYEPIWAIGTGLNATPAQVQEMHHYIRELLKQQYGPGFSEEVSIIYGGSCKPSNARELFGCQDVDGGLIGGASLLADDFLKIIQSF